MTLFNRKKGFPTQFIKEEGMFFEPLRSFHHHRILLHTLNQEFSISRFTQKGLIMTHFPLHNFKRLQQIRKSWNREKYSTLFDPLKSRASLKDLRPYNAIAFYYGCDVALYLSFNCVYTSWLGLLALVGVGFYVAALTVREFSQLDHPLNNFLTPVYVILVSVWVTVAFEKWKRREYELGFVWNTFHADKNQIERPDYSGKYIIDSITKQVTEEAAFSTKARIYLVSVPLVIMGLGLLIANFTFFVYLNELVANTEGLTWIWKTIYTAGVGALNATIIFIFTLLNNFCSEKAVDWENHKYEKSRQTSIVLKTFLFDFLIAYIILFYFGFIQHDLLLLTSNFTSLVITKNLLFNLKYNILPYFLFKFKSFLIRRKWRRTRQAANKALLQSINIDFKKHKFEDLQPEIQEKLLAEEKKLLLQEQVAMTMAMSPLPDLRYVWTNYAIQFGYVAFFSMVFPLAPLIGFLLNIFDLHFSYFSMVHHTRRGSAVERASIGIWNQIFMVMSYVSLIVNLLILVFSPSGLKAFLNLFSANYFESFTKNQLALLLIVAEHAIFFIKYLLDLAISDQPGWVNREIQRRQNLEYVDEEHIKRKFVQIKSERALRRKTKHLAPSLFAKLQEVTASNDSQL